MRVSVCFFKKVFLYFIIKYLLTLWFDFFLGSFRLQTREIWLVFFIKNVFIIILSKRLLTFRFLSFFRWFYGSGRGILVSFKKKWIFHNFTETFVNVSFFFFRWLFRAFERTDEAERTGL